MYTVLVDFMNTLNIISIVTEVSAQRHYQNCFERHCDKISRRHCDRRYHYLEIIRSM